MSIFLGLVFCRWPKPFFLCLGALVFVLFGLIVLNAITGGGW